MQDHLALLRMDALPTFAVTWLTITIGAVVSFFFQYGAARKQQNVTFKAFVHHCFPIESWRTKSNAIDAVMFFSSKIAGKILKLNNSFVTTIIATGIVGVLHSWFPGHAPVNAGVLSILAVTVVLFIISDLVHYTTHYLQHKVGFLWELHKVHHSATNLTILTSKRMHPLGDQLDQYAAVVVTSIPAGIAAFYFGFSMLEIFAMMILCQKVGTILVMDILKHGNFGVSYGWFDRILISPAMHHMHHSAKYEHWDKNIADRLAIWDWMFGTQVLPIKGQDITFGIGRGVEVDRQYETVRGVYWDPMVNMVRMLLGRIKPEVGPPGVGGEDAQPDALTPATTGTRAA